MRRLGPGATHFEMDKYTPIKFKNGHLGLRHKQINTLVREAISQNVSFESVKNSPETSAVDRLFKIDFASKCKNVDYIVESLKARSMLYVSRALRSVWLFSDRQYETVVNPIYLEEVLFPEMLTTAVNKTIHCIIKHLKDEKRYNDFYQYYKTKGNMKIAKRFLPKCPEGLLLADMELFMKEMSPDYLKLLCEKCPKVLLKYFNTLTMDRNAFIDFTHKEHKYIDVSRIVLKLQPQIYFEVIEKYCSKKAHHKRLSPKATKYIMQKHKDKYLAKPELYGGALLHLPTLALCLSEEEARELLLRLARAQYLTPWFTLTYKSGEPLLKRINKENKFKLVKIIFQKKNFGQAIDEAPYALPDQPFMDTDRGIFIDYDVHDIEPMLRCYLKKRKYCKWRPAESLMDDLYDKYRYVGFPKAFRELRVRLKTETSHHNRLIILNVLVSKTLKRADYVQTLLNMVGTGHANEPATLRAGFLRSLVRRAAAYSLPDGPWQTFQDMVLQVVLKTEVPCHEGVHAILIHNILNDVDTAPDVFEKFHSSFDPLNNYDLTASEKRKVYSYLYEKLLDRCKSEVQAHKPATAITDIWNVLSLIKTHKVDVNSCTEFLSILKLLIKQNAEDCAGLLMDLYKNKCCRRMFTKENFLLLQNQASYLNALRHDPALLMNIDKFEELASKRLPNFDRFFLKLKLYFEELVPSYLGIIEEKVKMKPKEHQSPSLMRGLCILQGAGVWKTVRDMGARGREARRLLAALTANIHMAFAMQSDQEKLYTDVGVIASRNALGPLPAAAVRAQLPALLGGPAPFVRLGVALAFDRLLPDDILNVIAHVRQNVKTKITKRMVLRRLYRYMCLKGEKFELNIWIEMQSVMLEFCTHCDEKLWVSLNVLTAVPETVKVEYCATILKIFHSGNLEVALPESVYECLEYVSDHLKQMKETEVLDILEYFFKNEFNDKYIEPFLNQAVKVMILARYLLLCETEQTQRERIANVGEPFLSTVKDLWNKSQFFGYCVRNYFNSFLSHLTYRKAILDSRYVSCMPILIWIVQHIHTYLDVKQHFDVYSKVHLTMLYYKTLQQIAEHQRDVLSRSKVEVGAAVGTVFGRRLAREHRQLLSDYFPTMTELYAQQVGHFFKSRNFGTGRVFESFVTSLTESLALSGGDCGAYFAAVLFQKLYEIGLTKDMRQIYAFIENSKHPQTQCFLSTYPYLPIS
ncbi:hypothetical protein EVAR_17804_1 [Eumeta japonica]|uniref:Uncharacterized protein n=1 Tax=Eumeta variegata TaxID=151549 RepID=A0A4C1TU40_EUMVA|nr:hypothetical protein EVAR_17804_1 [Eumeta japonica]